jgi:hypothetical protein
VGVASSYFWGAIFPRVAAVDLARAAGLLPASIGPLFAIAGIIFAPFTTLMYVCCGNPSIRISRFDWVWLALAFVIDLAGYGTSAWGGRYQVPNRENY